MLYKPWLVGIYARYITCWSSEVYVDILHGPMGLGYKPPPKQVIYLVYIPPILGL